jgi:flagellar biosynthesis/type III secretory pathway protein FliH
MGEGKEGEKEEGRNEGRSEGRKMGERKTSWALWGMGESWISLVSRRVAYMLRLSNL